MKAVNLIPTDAQRGKAAQVKLPRSPALIPLGLLAAALALVTIYVLTQNSISDRKAKIASTQLQLATVKAQAAELNRYAQFEQLAQARIQTIKQIATSRFNWDAALTDLSKVVPANTSLQALLGTVSPDASVSSTSGSTAVPTSQSLRSAIDAPAFAMQGCTKTHDDVARLISRLRVMDGVQRVTLSDSQKSESAQPGASVAGSGTPGAQGCGPNTPTFDLIVFFKPLPGATPSTVGSSTSVGTTAATTATTSGSTAGATTTSQQTSTTATTSQSSSTSVSGGSR